MVAKQNNSRSAEAKAEAEAQARAEAVPALSIVSRHEGFRRAGFAFGKEPKVIALANLSDDQVAALQGDPMLTVAEATLGE